MDDVSFGARLRRHREQAGLSQEELAERAGLTTSGISALERGERRRPYPHTVRALAEALHLDDVDSAALIAAVPSRSGGSTARQNKPEQDAGSDVAVRIGPSPTPMVGRDEELTILQDQLLAPEVRLLTLVGPGGVGKTRLATAAASELERNPAFPDGVWFVDLSAIREPALVPNAVARALHAPEGDAGARTAALEAFVADRRMLLVLDNFEQVLTAAADLGRLLAASPGLTVLATSREPLRLRWERTLPLPPLALPDPRHLPGLDELAEVPAVALFLERARATTPNFALTSENASAVANLCVRLDGLPLAIELVAARAAQLGPAAILDRLKRRLPFPVPSFQDAPARQQSLRATLQWSLDLLDQPEQALFRRLAVFSGGWTLTATEAVAGDDVPDALSGLTSLVDKSLVAVQDPGGPLPDASIEPRFRLLETAREVALELLEASGEADQVRMRHVAYFAGMAEEAEPQLHGANQAAVVRRLEREEDNFRQALRWSLTGDRVEVLEHGLRLAGALGWFWFLRGYPAEAREWFHALLHPIAVPERPTEPGSAAARLSALRARALNAAGFRAIDHGEYDIALTFHEQALSAWRALQDIPGLVASLHGVGDTALWLGDSERARASYEDGLALARATGTPIDVALFAFHLGQLWWLLGDLESAERYGQEALTVARAAGSTTWPAYSLFVLASVAHERDDTPRAGALYREALGLAWEHHDRLCVRMALPGLAALATQEGDAARAMRLAGAASALEENAQIWAFPPIRARHERWLAAAQQALDAEVREAAWTEGRGLTIDEVIAYALAATHPASPREPDSSVTATGPLSPREREVLALVAEGKSNREIAEALVVTEHTAKYHVTSLLNKLGASNRAEVVSRAASLGLLTPSRS
jgi:predicted ATPase/DNA-binding CsgD family transcriptional regulator/transcriptional regulator with XRE-family HTH domain